MSLLARFGLDARPMKPILDIARGLDIAPSELEPYGHNKAKVSERLLARLPAPSGKLILVTAINPTPFGEGKTVTTIGLGDALHHLQKRTIVCIREPSLGPTLGVKGGGAGGGKSQAYPADELNLHFTGDFHAVTYAHNLLASLAEARHFHGDAPHFANGGLWWKRVFDLTDRALREVVVGLGGKANGPLRETGFDITAASEVMATVAASIDRPELVRRLGQLVVGESVDGRPITALDLEANGAMGVLLKDAFYPNLIQTLEATPMLAHMGPFGNIAAGHNSVLADRVALSLADYVVTEAGFGSDLGFEKFCHLVAPTLGRGPDVAVVVATVRGLKAHSGHFKLAPGKPLPPGLVGEDLEALRTGAVNLREHLRIVKRLGVPAVVAVNRFPTDSEAELQLLESLAMEYGALGVARAEAYAKGGEGNVKLAEQVLKVLETHTCNLTPVYAPSDPLATKIEQVVKEVYGGARVNFSAAAKKKLETFTAWGYGNLPVCMAKTQYSLSADAELRGAPKGFEFPVTSVELAAGAGFVRVLSGEIMTMPGLGKRPTALGIHLDAEGKIHGMSW